MRSSRVAVFGGRFAVQRAPLLGLIAHNGLCDGANVSLAEMRADLAMPGTGISILAEYTA